MNGMGKFAVFLGIALCSLILIKNIQQCHAFEVESSKSAVSQEYVVVNAFLNRVQMLTKEKFQFFATNLDETIHGIIAQVPIQKRSTSTDILQDYTNNMQYLMEKSSSLKDTELKMLEFKMLLLRLQENMRKRCDEDLIIAQHWERLQSISVNLNKANEHFHNQFQSAVKDLYAKFDAKGVKRHEKFFALLRKLQTPMEPEIYSELLIKLMNFKPKSRSLNKKRFQHV